MSAARSILVAVFLGIAGTAVAGPLEDGETAYKRGDYAAALQLLRPLADQGIARAQLDLGLMYSGGRGVPQDYDAASRWYGKAADQGYAEAEFQLGLSYLSGKGVERSDSEAAKWFRKAADQANEGAQIALGTLYAGGHGVPRDYVLAHMWYNLVAVQGNGLAATMRDELAAKMTPKQSAEAQRLAREWKPK